MKTKAILLTLILLTSLSFVQCNGQSAEDKEERSIDKIESVDIGGIDQWIQIKGEDVDNPILLIIHGGPGFAMMPLFSDTNRALEKEFVVVNWDQRGSGKTYNKETPIESMTLEQFVSDANELTGYLKEQYSRNKIFVFGHSFGSLIGMKLIDEYPNDYSCLFTSGQVIDFVTNEQLGYDFALEKSLISKNGEATRILESMGRPDRKGNYLLEVGFDETSKYIEYYGGSIYGERNIEPIYDIIFESDVYKNDSQKLLEGYEFSQLLFDDENMKTSNLITDIKEVEVPVYFLLGRHDYETPSELAQTYYDILEAPHKEIVWFEESAHYPFYEEPNKFNETLINIVNKTK